MWATGLQYPVIWCTTSQPKLSSLSHTARKTRKHFVVSKVDLKQRKNGQNMTFWSTILEGLRVLSKWLVASHLQARVFLPRLEYLDWDLLRAQDQQEIGNSELKGWSRFFDTRPSVCNFAPLDLEEICSSFFGEWNNQEQSSVYDEAEAQLTGPLLNISCCLFRVSYNFALISIRRSVPWFPNFLSHSQSWCSN